MMRLFVFCACLSLAFAAFADDSAIVSPIVPGNQEKFDRMFFEMTEKFASRSKYAADKNNPYRDTLVGYVLQLDAQGHVAKVERDALMGSKDDIALVKREADAGDKDSQKVLAQIRKLGLSV